jgi:uncharacterized protein (TIGR02569 family)
MSRAEAPSREVLSAFGLGGQPVPVGGGQGMTWQLGTVMVKPGVDPSYQEWLATLTGIEQRGFRLAEPLPARDGRWVVQGWGAHRVLSGTAASGPEAPWGSVLGAARAFHEAVGSMPRPAFLDDRTDAWAVADRATWGEVDIELGPEAMELVRRLTPVARLTGTPQLVHGDLTGNVLLDPPRAPGIIDVSPYWRPVQYAEGIVVADALAWHRARPGLPSILGVSPEAVALGLLFRTHTAYLLIGSEKDHQTIRKELSRYAATADALGL